MPIIEALGWLAVTILPFNLANLSHPVDEYNTNFAATVDSGHSCFDRVGGEVGTYGGPGDYSLDLLCNYRLQSYQMEGPITKWRLIRSD